MTAPPPVAVWRLFVGPVVAVFLLAVWYGLARLPEIDAPARADLSGRFRFTALSLPEAGNVTGRRVREVHPALHHIAPWISVVGASIALFDLDGDGLPNDAAWVETRTDSVIVAPVPGTGERYLPQALDPRPLAWTKTMAPMGVLPGDLDEDGRQDLVVYCWGRSPIAFLSRGGGWSPAEIVDPPEEWYSNAGAFVDLDGDGHPDLVIGNYFADGSGVLDPVSTARVEMQDSMSRSSNGGRNRYLLRQGSTGGGFRFVDAASGLGESIDNQWTLALGAQDLDDDLLPELYFANDFGQDRLLHNRSQKGRLRFAILEGRRGFATPSSSVVGRDSFKGMGVDFGDVDGDGHLDIFVSNITTEFGLQEGQLLFCGTGDVAAMKRGRAPFESRGEERLLSRSGWAWDARLADFDNDGVLEALQARGFLHGSINRWPELHELAMGNDGVLSAPKSWFRLGPDDDLSGHEPVTFGVRAAGGRFVDLASEVGLDDRAPSRGLATADVDGDGDLDLAVACQWARSIFYRNDAPSPGRFLGLHLLVPLVAGEPSTTTSHPGHPGRGVRGRPAIGAKARVVFSGGRILERQVEGGNGHSGKGSPELHFGLASHPRSEPVRVDLRWRDPGGVPHAETLQLSPGWHTVVLGWPQTPERRR
jgi:hypothetical protein